MTTFFNRVIQFKTDDLLIEDLRIKFQITKSFIGYPNLGKFEIYNLSETSRNKLTAGESGIGRSVYNTGNGSLIEFSAGYEIPQLLFVGRVVNVIHKYISPDWVTEIYAGDKIDPLNTATMNRGVPAGTNQKKQIEQVIEGLTGVVKGFLGGLNQEGTQKVSLLQQIRSGSIKTILNRLSDNFNIEWSVTDGVLDTTQRGQIIEDAPYALINREQGMIGSPERTDYGVTVKTLLKPELRLARGMELRSINDLVNVGDLFFREVPPIKNDGVYRMDKLVHTGDNRDDIWQTEITGRLPTI